MAPLEIYFRDIAWRVKVVDGERNGIERKLGEIIAHSNSQQRADGANDPSFQEKDQGDQGRGGAQSAQSTNLHPSAHHRKGDHVIDQVKGYQ